MATKKNEKNESEFYCNFCNYVCSYLSDWERHVLTAKHLKLSNATKKNEKNEAHVNCSCGNIYKHKSSYYKHKKTCNFKISENIIEENKDIIDKNLILTLIQQNNEIQKQMIEVIKNGTINNTTNINSMNNSNNKTFNLQVFLNETCKDAVNWNDFIKSLPQSTNITKTICDGIEELGMYKRPVHCFEEKQLCIKHENVWEHDMNKINATMVQTNDTMKHQWEKDHPEWYNNAKETEEYTHLFQKEIKPDNLTTFTV